MRKRFVAIHSFRRMRVGSRCWISQSTRSWRQFSFRPLVSPQNDEVTVKVRVGSSGHILLNIHHPPRPASDGPIIVYLPRGPLASPEPNLLPSLATSSNSTVVRLNYRLSAQYHFPIPIHDVLAGYDWIRKHLGARPNKGHEESENSGRAKLGVCGEHVGGSLASMLALTECHTSKQGIAAAGIGNPITDWTLLSLESQKASSISTTSARSGDFTTKQLSTHLGPVVDQPLTTSSLLSLRDSIFPKAERYYDPFASPILFFRTPSFDLPSQLPMFRYGVSTPKSLESEDDTSVPLAKKRRSHRKYPPLSSDLQLPRMRVEIGNGSILKKQGLEFVELMRRSVDLWENTEGQSSRHKDGKNRVELVMRGGSGLWEGKEIVEIGNWFDEALH